MKQILLIIIFFLTINSISKAQVTVVDTHPNSSIFVIDYSTGQETPGNYDAAILFKDAFIELVSNTIISRTAVAVAPGKKTFTITQMDPSTNGNAYQLELKSKFLGQTIPVYKFVYNVDQNTLTYFNQQMQTYTVVVIQGANLNNLNNCLNYGKFNAPRPVVAAAPQPAVDAAVDETAPVDADVQAEAVPPALPDYEQPECPQEGYLWQPGYWAYRPDGGYYWVPGVWSAPPTVGLLWTPPYWGYEGRFYIFHPGYWGNTIGFYGGVYYGYGYGGHGYYGGEWRDGHFRYNTEVVRVNTTVVHTTYIDRTVVVNNRVINHTSFNGPGGIADKPNEHEIAEMHEKHIGATPEQIRNQRMAREDKSQFASANGGKPANIAATHVPERQPNVNRGNPAPGPVNAGAKPGQTAPTQATNAKPGAPGQTPPGVPGKSGAPGQAPPGVPGKPGAPGAPGAAKGKPAAKPAPAPAKKK